MDLSELVGLSVIPSVDTAGFSPRPSSGGVQDNMNSDYYTAPGQAGLSCGLVAGDVRATLVSWYTNPDGFLWMQLHLAETTTPDLGTQFYWFGFEAGKWTAPDGSVVTVASASGGNIVQYYGAQLLSGFGSGNGLLPFGGGFAHWPAWLQKSFGWLAWVVVLIILVLVYVILRWIFRRKRR